MLLNNLEDERWSISPKEVESRLVEKLENYQNEYNYAFIPHPIATSFYWASSANNPQEKYSRLETAFECSAHFYMSILFSVTEGTSDEFKDNIYDAIKRSSLKERNTLFDQTSFGDSVRLDYGTGHELAFCAFLLCCFKLGIFSSDDFFHIGALVFPAYNELVRELVVSFR